MVTKRVGSHPSASSAKGKVTGLLHALRRPIFKLLVQQQQGKANIAAHQAAHDSVAYHVLMGESAAHSSISTSVSNEQSPM